MKENKKDTHIMIRIEAKEKEILKVLAKKENRSLSNYMITKSLDDGKS